MYKYMYISYISYIYIIYIYVSRGPGHIPPMSWPSPQLWSWRFFGKSHRPRNICWRAFPTKKGGEILIKIIMTMNQKSNNDDNTNDNDDNDHKWSIIFLQLLGHDDFEHQNPGNRVWKSANGIEHTTFHLWFRWRRESRWKSGTFCGFMWWNFWTPQTSLIA